MTVYVCQLPCKFINGQFVQTRNVNAASKYGEIKEVCQPSFSIASLSPVKESVEKILSKFNPEVDFLLPIRDPLIIAKCIFVLSKKHKSFRVLKWNKKTQSYSTHCVY
jgi:hypothetical protein